MADNIKILGTEITLDTTTANTVSNAKVVRLVNINASTNVLITLKDGSDTIGTFTLGSSATDFSSETIIKDPTQTLIANTGSAILAAPIAYY